MSQSYQVFARKYRPRRFDDVLGQDHVVQTLKNAIAQDRLAHAYLFVGPRGTGKTSTARILAKALNCSDGPKVDFDPDEELCQEIAEGRCLDVLEIDGASNNGVEQVRELRENVKFAPARCRYKIYYIDEVHMLSNAAFNALLKTLEEPPEHVKFIFATTEANKILPTIISRCQRFDLRRIPTRIIAEHLAHIAEEEGLDLDPVAATAIAKGAEGGMRDAQSMLDQLVAFCGTTIREPDVLEVFGFTGIETVATLGGAILDRQTVDALEKVYEQSEAGKDLSKLLGDLIGHLRSVLVYKVDPQGAARELAPEILERVKAQAPTVETERLLAIIDHFAEVDGRMRWAPNKRLHLEVGVIKAVQILGETRLSDVINAIDGSLAAIPGGVGNATPPSAAPTHAQAPPTPSQKQQRKEPDTEAPSRVPPAREQVPAEPAPASKADAAARPEPAAPPEPSTPTGAVSGEDAWAAVVEHLERAKPMAAASGAKAVFHEDDGTTFTVAIAPTETIARSMLTGDRIRPSIEECLSGMLGARKLRVELREGVQPAAPPAEFAEVEEPPPPREETPKKTEPAPASPSQKETADKNGAQLSAEEEFRQDPFIIEALDVFEADFKP